MLYSTSPALAESRADQRHRVRLWAQLDSGAAFDGDVVVHDLSASGFRFKAPASFAIGTEVKLWIADGEALRSIVSHAAEGSVGCRFVVPLTESSLDGLLANGPFARARPVARSLEISESSVAMLPGWMRVAVVMGGATAGWAGIAGAALWLFR